MRAGELPLRELEIESVMPDAPHTDREYSGTGRSAAGGYRLSCREWGITCWPRLQAKIRNEFAAAVALGHQRCACCAWGDAPCRDDDNARAGAGRAECELGKVARVGDATTDRQPPRSSASRHAVDALLSRSRPRGG